MTTEHLPALTNLPRDEKTGVILPLSKSLGSRDLAKHRAMVAVELEVMAKKMDRFGWERDRGSTAHDRIITDWMAVLGEYPLEEVQVACRRWVETNPRKMPNEGDIKRLINAERNREYLNRKAAQPRAPRPPKQKLSADRASEILREFNFNPKRFG